MDECFEKRRDNAMITLKGIIDEDFLNYKKPSMTLMFPRCTFKCGSDLCQNSALAQKKDIQISPVSLYVRYKNNPITKAVVLQGLDPMDSWVDVKELLHYFRIDRECLDDIVIYTGYTEEEIGDKIKTIKDRFQNVIIKFGRYVPNQQPHYDPVLGVNLASDNQYAKYIS